MSADRLAGLTGSPVSPVSPWPTTAADTRPCGRARRSPAGALAAWLEREGLAERLGLGGPLTPLTIEQFPGGHSNLTYLVRAGGRELVLRRPPFGSTVQTAHDMGREFRVLSRLPDRLLRRRRAPSPHCDDPAVIGAPFYLMERVRGVILRGAAAPPGVDAAAGAHAGRHRGRGRRPGRAARRGLRRPPASPTSAGRRATSSAR